MYALLLCVAFSIEFGNDTFHHVAHLIAVNTIVVAITLGVHLHLVLHHFVCHLNIIIRYNIFGSQSGVELRSNCKVEGKLHVFLLRDVDGFLLLFVGQGLTKNFEFVLLDVIVKGILQHLVDFVHLDGGTVLALDEAHGNHTRTEAGDVGLLAEGFERFVYFLFIVGEYQLYHKLGLNVAYILQ